jgi:hypothetical protein
MIGARRQSDEWIAEYLRARGVVANRYRKLDAGDPARLAVQGDEATRHRGAGSNQLGTMVAQCHRDERKAQFSIRADETIKPAVEKTARDDTRTVTSYVERIIVEALRAKGT